MKLPHPVVQLPLLFDPVRLETARERIAQLIDPKTEFFELGLWAAWNLYQEWGGAPSAGVATGIGLVAGRQVMIIANDATVKAGAFFPMTAKKVLRVLTSVDQYLTHKLQVVDMSGNVLLALTRPAKLVKSRTSPRASVTFT